MKENLFEVTPAMLKEQQGTGEVNSVIALLRNKHRLDMTEHAEFNRIIKKLAWSDFQESVKRSFVLYYDRFAPIKILILMIYLVVFFVSTMTAPLSDLIKNLIMGFTPIAIYYVIEKIYKTSVINRIQNSELPIDSKSWQKYCHSYIKKHYYIPSNRTLFTADEIMQAIVTNGHKMSTSDYDPYNLSDSRTGFSIIADYYALYIREQEAPDYLDLIKDKSEHIKTMEALLTNKKHPLQISSQGFYKYLNHELDKLKR